MTSVNVVQLAEDGSNYYRNVLPARALKAQGADVELVWAGTEVRDAEVWVFNRPCTRNAVQVITELVSLGKRVVVDMDDLLGKVVPEHSMSGRAEVWDGYAKWACKEATAVTGSTPAVAAEYGGTVWRNCVPAWYLDYEARQHEGTWVGWSGTCSSHPTDLQTTHGRVAKAVSEAGAEIAYVGPKTETTRVRQALKYKAGILESGWFTFEDYPKALAEFDIGIVPLAASEFNTGKSWLKAAEMAAVGVPPLMSPTPENERLHSLGVGRIASNPQDWYRRLKSLIKVPELRAELAGKSRESMRSLTIEANCQEVYDAWVRDSRRTV